MNEKLAAVKIKLRQFLADEKDKLVIKNVVLSFFVKGLALVISFFSLPAYIRFFNNQEALGVWFTVLSILTVILSFDFGVGNGLRNRLVSAFLRDDKTEIRQDISSAYFVIGSLVAAFSAIGILVLPLINWNNVLNISSAAIEPDALLFAIKWIFVTIMLQFFLRLVSYILYALQKAAYNNMIALISSLLQLLFVLLSPSRGMGENIRALSIAYLISVNLPLLGVSAWLFATRLRGCLPRFKDVNKQAATSIMKLGGIFFWNQLVYMFLTNTNAFFIAKYINPAYVVDYQIYHRLFSVAGIVFALALTPMWSAITQAFEEKDRSWIDKYFRLLNRFVLLAAGFEMLLVPLCQTLIRVWLSENAISVKWPHALIFAVFGSIFVYHSVLSTFACGIGQLKLQAYFYSFGAIAKFAFILIGTHLYSDWIVMVLSDIFIFLPYCIFQHIALSKKIRPLAGSRSRSQSAK